METGTVVSLVIALIVVIVVLVTLAKTIRIIPQARAGIVERLGRYDRTLMPGLSILVPFIDRLKPLIDLREQVVSFPPQPVITEDNLVVGIDTVLYFQITEPKAAVYEIANYIQAVEQLTVTTLRNVVGNLNLEEALTSRDHINAELRGVLDEATGKWGIRVNRVEIKAIEPPPSIKDSMEKQMRAERDRRAAILTAEGVKQSAILTAEGQQQSAILNAEGAAQAAILRADGESKAIQQVFEAIHAGNPDQKLLAYQYLQTLPQIAREREQDVDNPGRAQPRHRGRRQRIRLGGGQCGGQCGGPCACGGSSGHSGAGSAVGEPGRGPAVGDPGRGPAVGDARTPVSAVGDPGRGPGRSELHCLERSATPSRRSSVTLRRPEGAEPLSNVTLDQPDVRP